MPRRNAEPRWLSRRIVDALHEALLAEHGGASGVRDDGAVEAALARPRHKHAYEKRADVAALAAAYCYGLVRSHGYVDGNKRTGFMAAYVFLNLNGLELNAPEPDVATTIENVAAGRLSEPRLAEWIRGHVEPGTA
jgi:death-on-curing protein